jgi:hypothetical protein
MIGPAILAMTAPPCEPTLRMDGVQIALPAHEGAEG